MKISRQSPFTDIINTMDLPITEEQYQRWLRGAYAQDVFPHLTPSQREFIISGCMPEDWDYYMGSRDDDDEKEAE